METNRLQNILDIITCEMKFKCHNTFSFSEGGPSSNPELIDSVGGVTHYK